MTSWNQDRGSTSRTHCLPRNPRGARVLRVPEGPSFLVCRFSRRNWVATIGATCQWFSSRSKRDSPRFCLILIARQPSIAPHGLIIPLDLEWRLRSCAYHLGRAESNSGCSKLDSTGRRATVAPGWATTRGATPWELGDFPMRHLFSTASATFGKLKLAHPARMDEALWTGATLFMLVSVAVVLALLAR